jgi:hypothetical protein
MKKRERRDELMIVYVVFCKDYEHRRGELMGMLVERRKDTRGETQWESGAKWARQAFGHLVKNKRDIFVFPKEMEINDDKGLLVEKGIYSKEEFLEVMKTMDQEFNRKGE